MNYSDIANYRISAQHINGSLDGPAEVLEAMGAVQAQDYTASVWAMGLRCKEGTTAADIEKTINERKIARTWLMRGTLHFAASKDIRWMLKLFAPRLLHTAIMRDQHLGLSNEVVEKTKKLFYNALKKEKQLTRKEMYKVLEKAGVPSKNNLGYHMLYRAAYDGLICFGPYSGKEQTFVLMDDHIGGEHVLSAEQANAELAKKYFTSHGPATIRDYVWWSGLTVKDAKAGIERAGSAISEETVEGKAYYMSRRISKPDNRESVHLLPAFDEYLVSYADREAMLGNPQMQRALNGMLKTGKVSIIHSNGIFVPVIVVDGEVVGTWGRKIVKGKMVITLKQYVKLSKDGIREAKEEAGRYGSFFGLEAVVNY
jgi:hypothetical protein